MEWDSKNFISLNSPIITFWVRQLVDCLMPDLQQRNSYFMHKKELGLALLAELDKGYDIVRLSRWAFKVFASQDPRFLSDDKRELLIELSSMEDDPQFEYSEEELRAHCTGANTLGLFFSNLTLSPCSRG